MCLGASCLFAALYPALLTNTNKSCFKLLFSYLKETEFTCGRTTKASRLHPQKKLYTNFSKNEFITNMHFLLFQ